MDFYQLDTDAQVERLEQLAHSALENWTLDADRLDLIPGHAQPGVCFHTHR